MYKLLQINICPHLSTGKIAQSIGDKAIYNGWESWLVYSCRIPETYSNSKTIRIGYYLDPYFHYIENRLFDREGLSSRYATRRLVEQIKQIQPNVIHLHNIHDHWLNYMILFEYVNTVDIPIVWTFHDCWAFTGHCFHFVTKKCEKWKTGCYDCPLVHEYPNTLFDRSKKNYELKKRLFGDCNNLTIVSCSDWMSDLVKQSFLKDKNTYVIKNGVDLTVFRPLTSKLSLSDGVFRILAVSNVWNKEKGLEDIFQLRKKLPIANFNIIIVGLNKMQIKTLPIGVEGIERTQNMCDLVKLYSVSDVLINTTYADTFPTVNLEALACGTPVITYNTGGAPEAVDEKTGVVIEQGNVEALANAIYNMKVHPLSSDDCRMRAVQEFDKDKCFEKYIKLYESLLK